MSRSAQKSTEELVATVSSERYRNGSFVILTTSQGICKGNCEPGEILRGNCYKFYGRTIEDPRYGTQFEFYGFTCVRAPGERGFIAYLESNCEGIGKALAKRIWDTFGEQAVEALREQPAKVAAEVRGLTLGVAQAAAQSLRYLKDSEEVQIKLLELLAGRHLPKQLASQLVRLYGKSAPDKVIRNPYLLMQFDGVGFNRADELYCDLAGQDDPTLKRGKSLTALKRQTLCLWHAIDSDSDGSTWFPAEPLQEALTKKVGSTDTNFNKAIELGTRCKKHGVPRVLMHREVDGQHFYSTAERGLVEAEVVRRLGILASFDTDWPPHGGYEHLSEHQSQALFEATIGPVGILAGGPGTGKTFSVAQLIGRLNYTGKPVYVVAPTGKAAVRLTSTMQKYNLFNRAGTIHSLLGWRATGPNFNERQPLTPGYLIVDESSMVSAELLACLLRACKNGMHVLFVGDDKQLSPVGYGSPLRDMIRAGLPCGRLTEIRRNAGSIVRVCAAIARGSRIEPDRQLALPEANLVCFDNTSDQMQLQQILAEYKRAEELFAAESQPFDPLRDVQVLCSVNGTVGGKNKISRVELNRFLQPKLNPSKAEFDNQKYFAGDKVICLKNTNFKALNVADTADPEDDPKAKHFVANGEVGFVRHVDGTVIRVEFEFPYRYVQCFLRGEESNWIDLAYAITTHKSQGSEWPVVLVMIDGSGAGNWIGTRELIYTAISRASKYCVLIGSLHTANHQCRVIGLDRRKTFLKEDLQSVLHELAAVPECEVF